MIINRRKKVKEVRRNKDLNINSGSYSGGSYMGGFSSSTSSSGGSFLDSYFTYDSDKNLLASSVPITTVGSLVATREDNPLLNGIAYYDSVTSNFKTKAESSLSVGYANNKIVARSN